MSKLHNIPWVLRVEDLYPDTAVAAGLITNRFAISLFYWLEKFLYKRANQISLISESFRKNLLKKGIVDQKLSVTPVWADPDTIQPSEKNNSFRKEHGLIGKFVVMYSGNLGSTSSLEDLLDAAKLLVSRTDIKFMIVGEGVKKAALEHFADENGLNNVCFLPYQPRERLSEMLSAADVGVVTLNTQLANTSLPSKTFAIMASERPILAITPEDSEVAAVVQKNECGVNVPPNRSHQVADEIVRLSRLNGDLIQMGKNGREALLQDYSRKVCVEQIESVIGQAGR